MQEIISRFKAKPKTKLAWRVMYLGLATLFIPMFLGIFAAIVRPLIDRMVGETIGRVAGFGMGLFIFAFSIFAFVEGVRAFKKGERSWVLWLGLIPASLIIAFWLFMIIGEFIFPH